MANIVLPPGVTTETQATKTCSAKPKVFTNPERVTGVTFCKVASSDKCIQCNDIAVNAYQLPCGDQICVKDYEKLDKNQNFKCPIEECGTVCPYKMIRPDTAKRKEISSLLVYCPNEPRGCKEKIQWQKLEKHQRTCEFELIPCSHSECNSTVLRKNKETHERKKCTFRPELCLYCTEEYPLERKKDHLEKQCGKIPTECPNNCGVRKMPREEMDVHVEECPNKQVTCQFANIGCQKRGTKKDLEFHEKKSTFIHLNLLYSIITELLPAVNEDCFALQADFDSLKDKFDSLKHSDTTHKELRLLYEETKIIGKQLEDVKRLIEKDRKRHDDLSGSLEDRVTKTEVDQVRHDITVIKDTKTNISDRIQELDKLISKTDPSQNNEKKIHQRMALLDTALSELSLRCHIFEAMRYDGIYIWKITKYYNRKRDAAGGRTLSMFSEPFHTSKYGYKMCARVYLNGDGTGKGTHLSFFFIVMKGDFDTFVPWPFKQTVSLMLMSQDGSKHDKCRTFIPELSSRSFQKPVTEMNIASGIPEFISHRELETPKYLQDDTIFLKITVDTGKLPML